MVDPAEPVERAVERCQAALRSNPRDVTCARCERVLCVAVKSADHPVPLSLSESTLVHLNPEDYCRYCARPLSAKAIEKQAHSVVACHDFARMVFKLDRTRGQFEIATE